MAGDDELPSLDDWGPVDDEWGPSHFLVPPPPPPPSLGSVCTTSDFYCQLEGGPMGAHFNRASFPSLPIIAVCSSVVLVAVLVASFLLWRHKTKVQNLLPCKNEQQGHLGELGAATNGVTYEDVLINHHPTRIPQGHMAGSQTLMPLEMLDVKLGELGSSQISGLHHVPCYPSRDTGHVLGGKPFHPVYEEVSQVPSANKTISAKGYQSDFERKLGGRSLTSDDDFAEEDFAEYPSGEGSGQCSATSSVRGSTGGDLCKDPVSSDEGTGEDCDYMINDLPEMLPGQNSFNYPIHPQSDMSINRPDKLRKNMPCPRGHNATTYPLADRTANVLPPTQRLTGIPLHSKLLTDNSKRHMSNVPSAAIVSPLNPQKRGATSPQWRGGASDMNYPTSASQENIYSTIDEEELVDYPSQPALTSLACSQRGSPLSKASTAMPKSAPVRGDRVIPPLSQREENGSSYGDIMPAFHSAFM